MVNGKEKDKNITTLIREIDAKRSEREVVQEAFPENWEWVDVEARNCFDKGVGAGTLKCVRGFNHHGSRTAKINKEIINNKCPRCNELENWECVMRCPANSGMHEEHISSMREELLKIKNFSLVRNAYEWFLEDAKAYLSRQDNLSFISILLSFLKPTNILIII